MVKKTVALVLVVLGLSLSLVSPASAAITTLTIDGKASVSASKTSVLATGSVICASGDTVDISVIVVQTRGQTDTTGVGTTEDLLCTGTLQPYTVQVNVLSGTGFSHGPASGIAQAFDSAGDSQIITSGLKL